MQSKIIQIQSKVIQSVVNEVQEVVVDLNDLIKKDVHNNVIYKRAFIRRLCHLGEALTYFRTYKDSLDPRLISNPYLKEIQDQGSKLIEPFVKLRNFFRHSHEHNEEEKRDKFDTAIKHLEENIGLLDNTLKNIALKAEVQNGEKCFRKRKNPPDDESKNTLLDYARYIDAEISAMLDTINSNKIDINNISGADKKYIEFALENYIENICSMILSYNNRFDEGYEVYNSDKKMNELFNNLVHREKDFFLKGAGKFRHGTAHNLKKGFNSSSFLDIINKSHQIQIKYIQPVITDLEKKFNNKFNSILMNTPDLIDHFNKLKGIEAIYMLNSGEYKFELNLIRLSVMNIHAKIFIDETHINALSKYKLILTTYDGAKSLKNEDFNDGQFYLALGRRSSLLYSVLTPKNEIKRNQTLNKDFLIDKGKITAGKYDDICSYIGENNLKALKKYFPIILDITTSLFSHTSSELAFCNYWTEKDITNKNLNKFHTYCSSLIYLEHLFSNYLELKKENVDKIILKMKKLDAIMGLELIVEANNMKSFKWSPTVTLNVPETENLLEVIWKKDMDKVKQIINETYVNMILYDVSLL